MFPSLPSPAYVTQTDTSEEYGILGLAFFTPGADLNEKNADTLTHLCIQMNRFAAWWSADARCPEKRFSHVELLLEDGFSYSIKMGSCVSQTWRTYKDRDLYGFLNVRVKKKHLHEIQKVCLAKVENKVSFSYWGIFVNFILPTRVKRCIYRGGVFRSDDATFCSKFVAEILLKGEVLDESTTDPDITSPNTLWASLIAWSEVGKNYARLINTNKPAHSDYRQKVEELREVKVVDTN